MHDAIKKLEPYSSALTDVGIRTQKIRRLRSELNSETERRRKDLARARDLGASRDELADAAGVSAVRVSQILSGGGDRG